MSATIEIQGLERLRGRIRTVASGRYLRAVLTAAALDLKGYMAWYPPATDANNPMARRWYERGFGPRWRRADGSVGGYKTSERLDARWSAARPRVDSRGLVARVGVRVSYAPYVQSAARQTWYHKRTGWRTDKQAVDARGPHIVALVERAVRQILAHEQAMAGLGAIQDVLKGMK